MRENKRTYYPITHAQKRIYYDEKIYPGTSVGTQAFIVRYKKLLDMGLLEQAINIVIQKNDGFRLRIIEVDYEPRQYVEPYKEISLDYMEFVGPDCELQLREWVGRTTQEPIEILNNDLFYFSLIKINESGSGYYMKFHHVASDGWSYPNIFTEINKIYNDLEMGNSVDDSPNPSYVPYIAEEQSYLNSDQVNKDKEFWHKTFLPLPPQLNITPKKGDPGNIKGNVLVTTFPDDVLAMMDDYCTTYRTSHFKLITAGISVYCARVSGIDDVSVGGVNHNRFVKDPQKRKEREQIVGMFVSTIPFRVKVVGDITFSQLVSQTGDTINFTLKNHQQYPFDRLATELRDVSGEDVSYLIDILISGHGDVEKENFTFEHIYQGYTPVSINLHINYNNKYLDGILELEYEYRNAHYKQADMVRIHQGLVSVLKDALGDPEKKVSAIELMSPEEKEKLLYSFNDSSEQYLKDKTIQVLFEEQVQKTPSNSALSNGDGETLTYRELNEKANALAAVLKEKGAGPGQITGIMVKRSTSLITGIIAVLKSGSACLALDPLLPETHISHMLNDSECRLLVTGGEVVEGVEYDGVAIDMNEASSYNGDTLHSAAASTPGDLAYIVYTSNVKGDLVGVMIEHVSLINKLITMQKKYPVNESDVCLLKTSCRFTLSIPELFGWFLGGGRLFILEKDTENDPQQLLNVVHSQKISHIYITPTVFKRLVNILNDQNLGKLSSLRYIFISGEVVAPEAVIRFKRLNIDIAVEYLYGDSETSLYTSSYSLAKWPRTGNIPIGTPLDNIRIYILNFINNEPVLLPIGVAGELCISGIGLSSGYLKNPELTKEKFIDNPFADSDTYKKLYRTGDLARWLPDGNIEYLGRIQHMVKIRGSRIDRIEIENHLLKLSGIKEAVVVVREDKTGIYLCAYIVSDEDVDTSILRDELGKRLPSHMIPSYFMQIKEIPLTPDGRIDRSELMDVTHDPHLVEEMLAEIEAEVLRLNKDEIDLDENFFTMGGHSYKAAQVAAKIHKSFNVKISMAEIFKRPTLRQLSEFLTESIEVKYAAIQPAEPQEYYPMSSAQKRLYFLQQLEEGDTVYNIQMIDIYCKGIEKERLDGALKALIKRHESLRTSFHTIDKEPVQKIHEPEELFADFKIEYFETDEDGNIYACDTIETGDGKNLEGVPFQEVIKGFVRPFDLSKAPLLRVGFIKILGNTKILMMDMHHMIADGISMEILTKELWSLYDGIELAPLRLQYKDFSQWLISESRMGVVKEQEDFWLKEFAGEIPLINLPTDHPRPAKLSFEGDTLLFEIDTAMTQKLHNVAAEYGESLYMVLFAAYNVLLAKLSGQDDIVVGTVTAGRSHEDLQNIVGMFVNTLALRNYPEGGKTFEEFMMEVKVNTFAAFENQDYPLEELVSRVASREETGRNPLFDVAFGLENEVDPTGYLMEVAVPDKTKPYDFGAKKSKFDMTLVCFEVEKRLECIIEYKTNLFKQKTIERFAGYFEKIVSALCLSTGQKIAEIGIISETEKAQILFEFNDTKADYPTDKTIYQAFQEQVEKTPDNIAVIFQDKRLSYREFDEKSNQLARIFRSKGIEADTLVGIMVERSLEMMIGIFAIQKAGGAYLPIEPHYPKKRIDYLLTDSSAKLLLTLGKFMETIETVQYDGEVINLEDQSLYQGDRTRLELVNTPRDMAYVIYTSGSTGNPKGVIIEHQAAINRMNWMQKQYPIGPRDVILQKTTFVFDVSVWELFWWSLLGAAQCLLIPGGEKRPEDIIEAIERHNVSTMHFVPSMLSAFLAYMEGSEALNVRTSLKQVFASGEALTLYHAEKFNELVHQRTKKARLINLYGPTEATVDVSYFDCPTDHKPEKIPIGKPVENTHLLVVNSIMDLQPVEIAGELCISGDQLARGYLNRPQLTSEKFVENPHAKLGDWGPMYDRLYRTGDLAHWLPDGNIEYLGRIDFQVKVRGFRIELGEIESRLMEINGMKEAFVLAKDDSRGEKFLCAYFVADGKADISSIRTILSKNMPSYMVPSYLIQIDSIPLTPNGKLDRRALPEPEAKVETEYAAPTNETEEILAEVWADVLGTEKVGIDDNFFEIGGDSIKTIMIAAKLKKRNVDISINDFFVNKTIRQLAEHVKKSGTEVEQGVIAGNVELLPFHKWLFENVPDVVHHFNQVVMLSRKEQFDPDVLHKVFTKIVEHHDALRMVYEVDKKANVTQTNRGLNEGQLYTLEVFDFRDRSEYNEEIEKEVNRINTEIDLKTGPLVKLGLFKSTDGDYLMIAIHRAVMDRSSWDILIEDFQTAYEQAQKGTHIKLPEKTTSYKQWASEVKQYADSPGLLKEIENWKTLIQKQIEPLSEVYEAPKETRTYINRDSISLELDNEMTEKLLSDVNWPYNTRTEEILLSALAMTLAEESEKVKMAVNLESDSRKGNIEYFKDLDLSRTIGAFTIKYPFLLNLKNLGPEDLDDLIVKVKETLRNVPNEGIGYGILKYLTSQEKNEDLAFLLQPEIGFHFSEQPEE